MIPKIIHYCWFGGKPLPELATRCITSWRKILPDYRIKEWNENNFDLDLFQYTREAYDLKKYAFVTDVVRLFVLQTEGGVYMDTDVEILKPIDLFLNNCAFSGFESDHSLPTGIMASVSNGQWISDLLKYYKNKSFFNSHGQPDLITNVVVISNMMKIKGFQLNNKYQIITNYVAFYPSEYFCPKSPANGTVFITENTVCIHHFAGSWVNPISTVIRFKILISKILSSIIGQNNCNMIIQNFKKYSKLA